MTDHWDDFSKSLAEDLVPRRQSLRLLGAAIAGAVLSPLGSGLAWAAGTDPCKAFCRCANKKRQTACLATCRACRGDTRRLCGSCGSGYVCTDLNNDFDNCGACNHVCEEPGPYEHGACLGGECVYACAEGAVMCFGACTSQDWDPDNCGACGRICPAAAPYCAWGTCSTCPAGLTMCNGECVDVWSSPANCGGCGNVCGVGYVCYLGSCCNPTAACCHPECAGATA
jgi:hypothetical protein